MIRFLLALGLSAAMLTGCASRHLPLNAIPYDSPVTVKSNHQAQVVVVSGDAQGAGRGLLVPVGGTLVSMGKGKDGDLQFNREDQQAFGESLRRELVRTGILGKATSEAVLPQDLLIKVQFDQTRYLGGFQEYQLEVTLNLSGGVAPNAVRFKVLSSEKDTSWERMNTNSPEGKEKAVRRLMEKMIPEIEAYVAKADSKNSQ